MHCGTTFFWGGTRNLDRWTILETKHVKLKGITKNFNILEPKCKKF